MKTMKTILLSVAVLLFADLAPGQDLRRAVVSADVVVVATGIGVRPIGPHLLGHRLRVATSLQGEAHAMVTVIEHTNLSEHARPTPAVQRLYCLIDFTAKARAIGLPERFAPYYRMTGHRGGSPVIADPQTDAIVELARAVLDSTRDVDARTTAKRLVQLALAGGPEVRTEATATLTERPALRAVCATFDAYLRDSGYLAMGGQIVDASIVPVPKQHNTRQENDRIKAGDPPEDWADKSHKSAQKDVDARWTKKHGRSHYGYKNHINVDRRHKFIRNYEVTDASVHDSRALDDLIDAGNTSSDFWGDSAYRSQETESNLGDLGYRSHIHHKGKRGKQLTERQKKANKTRSKVRARVEHVFGFQENSMGGKFVRTIGITRAKVKIGLMNLVYNMSRLVQREKIAGAV